MEDKWYSGKAKSFTLSTCRCVLCQWISTVISEFWWVISQVNGTIFPTSREQQCFRKSLESCAKVSSMVGREEVVDSGVLVIQEMREEKLWAAVLEIIVGFWSCTQFRWHVILPVTSAQRQVSACFQALLKSLLMDSLVLRSEAEKMGFLREAFFPVFSSSFPMQISCFHHLRSTRSHCLFWEGPTAFPLDAA